MVIIRTRAVEVSIQAVSPLLGLALELAGAAGAEAVGAGAAAVVAGDGVGAEPEAAAVTLPAVWAWAAGASSGDVARAAIKAIPARRLTHPQLSMTRSSPFTVQPEEK